MIDESIDKRVEITGSVDAVTKTNDYLPETTDLGPTGQDLALGGLFELPARGQSTEAAADGVKDEPASHTTTPAARSAQAPVNEQNEDQNREMASHHTTTTGREPDEEDSDHSERAETPIHVDDETDEDDTVETGDSDGDDGNNGNRGDTATGGDDEEEGEGGDEGEEIQSEAIPEPINGVIIPRHLSLSSEAMTADEINAVYDAAMNSQANASAPLVVMNAWRHLELSLCQQVDSVPLEARREDLDDALHEMRSILVARGESFEGEDRTFIDELDDAYRYLMLAEKFAPNYKALQEGRPPSNTERQEVYTGLGLFVRDSLVEIEETRIGETSQSEALDERQQGVETNVRGNLAELVTISVCASPHSPQILYPNPQRGNRLDDANVQYRDTTGRIVARDVDIKFLRPHGGKGERANSIHAGRIAVQAVYPKAQPTSENWGRMAWSALVTVAGLVEMGTRGASIGYIGNQMLGRFAWGVHERIGYLNDNSDVSRFLVSSRDRE